MQSIAVTVEHNNVHADTYSTYTVYIQYIQYIYSTSMYTQYMYSKFTCQACNECIYCLRTLLMQIKQNADVLCLFRMQISLIKHGPRTYRVRVMLHIGMYVYIYMVCAHVMHDLFS